MKIPIGDQFIHRALFHEKQIAFKKENNKKDTKASTSIQLLENFKRENSDWPFFLSFQEFVSNWIREIVIRPSKLSIILSATLYLTALASTIQKREGDRWFRFFLNSKLPGYSTISQETPWESFHESDFKKYFDNSIYIQHDKTSTNSTKFSDLSQKEKYKQQYFSALNKESTLLREKSDHTPFLNKDFSLYNQKHANLFGLEGRKLVDMYKDKLYIYPFSPLHKHVRKDFVGVFAHRQKTFSTNTSISTPIHVKSLKSSTHSPKSKLLQNARLPLFRLVPTHSHILENDCSENVVPSTSLQNDNLILPWYQIHACNKANRTLFAAPKQKNSLFSHSINRRDIQQDIEKIDAKTCSDIQQSSRHQKREQSRFGLLQKKKKSTISFPSIMRLNFFPIQSKIWGLEYLFLFQTSRQRLYAEADFIPFKLDSAYSGFVSQKESQNGLRVEKKGSSLHEYSDLRLIGEKEKKENNKLFTNKILFCGQNFSFFEKELRELFYLDGLKPASHFSMFGEDGLANSFVQKQGKKTKKSSSQKKHNFKQEENSHVDTKMSVDTKNEGKNNISLEDVLHKKISSKEAVSTILRDDFSNNASSYNTLMELIFQQLKKQSSPYNGMHNKIVEAKAVIFGGMNVPDTFDFLSTSQANDPEKAQMRYRKHKTSTTQENNVDTLSLFDENSFSQENRLRETQKSDNSGNDFSLSSFDNTSSSESSQVKEKEKTGIFPLCDCWPLFSGRSSFAKENENIAAKAFEKNNLLFTRVMSGYRFPDCTRLEINSLYRKFVLPHLFLSCSLTFSPSYVLDQALLCPLSIKLPPFLPTSFFQNLAVFFDYGISNLSENLKASQNQSAKLETANTVPFAHTIPKDSQLQFAYKRLSLQEFKEVKDAFLQLGRDFQDYISRPKDSPPAIRISPSLDDDDLFQREDAQKEKRDDDRATTFERLQKIRRREHKLELAKKLRPFAYKKQYALSRDTHTKYPSIEKNQADSALYAFQGIQAEPRQVEPRQPALDSEYARASARDTQDSFSNAFKLALQAPQKAVQPGIQKLRADSADLTAAEKAWLFSRLGPQNMRSDRRHNFFGRKHLLTKRLVAHEQKEIRDQVVKKSFSAPHQSIKSRQAQTSHQDAISPARLANRVTTAQPTKNTSLPAEKRTSNIARNESNIVTKGENKHEKQEYAIQQGTGQSKSLRRLQRKARKGSIQLLGSPEFAAHQALGITDRTRKAHRALRGKLIKSAYSHLRWQKKRFRSRMLGTPCKRHLVMPKITQNDWKRILKWQLKNYFFLEEKRLQPLVKENPEKVFKIRQLDIYLPWITLRSASNAPFQWPYTRLDNIECTLSPLIQEKCCDLPPYTPVLYWDSGKAVSISQAPPLSLKEKEGKVQPLLWKFLKEKGQDKTSYATKKGRALLERQNGIRSRMKNEPYLCERSHSQSYLLVYRLFLAFACKQLFQYMYRVSLKRFLIQMVNTDSGLMLTSPEFREWLENAPPKSVYTPQKRFKDITVREDNIPILSETVWHLRNLGRGKTASQGLLLVGPPASEKTSLVQAIAGESGLAIVVQSMRALALTYEEPYEQLENAFALARKNAPCVLFLDDLDAIGQSRADVIRNDTGAPDLLLALDTYTREGKLSLANSRENFKTHLLPGALHGESGQEGNNNANSLSAHQSQREQESVSGTRIRDEQSFSTSQQNDQEFQARRINLLLRLLTEMDGIVPLHGVVILATSEQPALLDPALLRAGRFERKIHLGLPDQKRRIQLFQAQTQKLGHMQAIPWDYLGLRTANMSGLDITSAINHSAIRAILDNTLHTIESLEHGLNSVSGVSHRAKFSPLQDDSISHRQQTDPFSSSRLAFFQAGKAVVHHLLLDHPELGFCSYNDALFSSHNTPLFSGIRRKIVRGGGKRAISKGSQIPPRAKLQSHLAFLRKKQHLFRLKRLKSQTLSTRKVDKAVHLKSQSLPLKKSVRKTENESLFFFSPSQKESQKGKASQATSTTQSYSARTRLEFESRLVGLYAGKAAELLHLSSNTVADGKKMQTENNTSQFSKAEKNQLNKICKDWGENSFSSLIKKKGLATAWLWQSNLGSRELLTASSLIHVMIDRWYLSSQKLLSYKTNRVFSDRFMTLSYNNALKDESVSLLAQKLSEELQLRLLSNPRENLRMSTSARDFCQKTSQDIMKAPWCQANICQALEMAQRPYGKWYRMYLPHIEEREQNEEWLPPDPVVHESVSLHNLTKTERVSWDHDNRAASFLSDFANRAHSSHNILLNKERTQTELLSGKEARQEAQPGFNRLRFLALSCTSSKTRTKQAPLYKNINDLYLLERDKHYQNLVMDSFYTAFRICHENRELLDLFADHLVRFQILRSHEIERMCQLFS